MYAVELVDDVCSRMVSSPFPFSVIARAGPCLVGSRSVNFVESLI